MWAAYQVDMKMMDFLSAIWTRINDGFIATFGWMAVLVHCQTTTVLYRQFGYQREHLTQ